MNVKEFLLTFGLALWMLFIASVVVTLLEGSIHTVHAYEIAVNLDDKSLFAPKSLAEDCPRLHENFVSIVTSDGSCGYIFRSTPRSSQGQAAASGTEGQQQHAHADTDAPDFVVSLIEVDGGQEASAASGVDASKNLFVSLLDREVHAVKFFAPWCGHCKRMADDWRQLSRDYEENANVKILEVDCTKFKSLCLSEGANAYPTLKLYGPAGVQLGGEYLGPRNAKNLAQWIDKALAEKGLETQASNNDEVVLAVGHAGEAKVAAAAAAAPVAAGPLELTADNFHRTVDQTGVWFVKFYAPWCGHCKRMEDEWKLFAQEHPEYQVASLDGDKYSEIGSQYGVRGFPTLLLLDNGKEAVRYSGPRTRQEFTNFVETYLSKDSGSS